MERKVCESPANIEHSHVSSGGSTHVSQKRFAIISVSIPLRVLLDVEKQSVLDRNTYTAAKMFFLPDSVLSFYSSEVSSNCLSVVV